MAIPYRELLQRPHLRSKTVEIDGLGAVEIHELPAGDIWDISRAVADDPDTDNRYYARIVLRSLAAGKAPTDEDVAAFVANVGQDVIGQLFTEILQYNQSPVTPEALDDAKKN